MDCAPGTGNQDAQNHRTRRSMEQCHHIFFSRTCHYKIYCCKVIINLHPDILGIEVTRSLCDKLLSEKRKPVPRYWIDKGVEADTLQKQLVAQKEKIENSKEHMDDE